MKTQHTPGPWEAVVKDDKYGKEILIVGASTGEESPVVCGCVTNEDDLFLIAAAPELLGALEYLLAQSQKRPSSPDNELDIAWGEATTVIAKAKGKIL